MELLSGGEMLVRFLRDEGVKYIYGYPGGALLHVYDALFKEPEVTHILVRHEQAATHMADGYARATGKAGVVLVTSGPGATNAITGIATAYMDSIPMVIISGQVPSTMVGTDAFQETDMIGISRPIVKHSFMIKHASEIPEVMKKAFYLAQSGRPGPVVVDIPKDMTNPAEKFEYVFPKKAKLRSYSPALRGHSGQIRKAAEMLLAYSPLSATELHRIGFVNQIYDSKKYSTEQFNQEIQNLIKEKFGHLHPESLLVTKKFMRQAVTKNYAEANALEVVAGTQQFAKGVPQERFRKLKTGELKHKL